MSKEVNRVAKRNSRYSWLYGDKPYANFTEMNAIRNVMKSREDGQDRNEGQNRNGRQSRAAALEQRRKRLIRIIERHEAMERMRAGDDYSGNEGGAG